MKEALLLLRPKESGADLLFGVCFIPLEDGIYFLQLLAEGVVSLDGL